jgi:hypothetical protein
MQNSFIDAFSSLFDFDVDPFYPMPVRDRVRIPVEQELFPGDEGNRFFLVHDRSNFRILTKANCDDLQYLSDLNCVNAVSAGVGMIEMIAGADGALSEDHHEQVWAPGPVAPPPVSPCPPDHTSSRAATPDPVPHYPHTPHHDREQEEQGEQNKNKRKKNNLKW